MARRKKKTQTKEAITSRSAEQSLSYQGKVKVQVLHGSRVVSTKTYTNKGLPLLFKYISYVLAGQYYKDMRPTQIKLFKYKDTSTSPENFDWKDATNGKLIEASPYVVYDATPVINHPSAGSSNEAYSTTFRFKIPFYWLYSKEFNVIGLYSAGGDACAYYLFKKETSDSESKKIVWDTQQLDDTTGNYSLIIEWTLEVSNK